ncbi:MAG TPA: cytochrome P450 [Acidimicrobiales bacterium]|nr:cytochrome P450 [Acidimicrobiales bacterium]
MGTDRTRPGTALAAGVVESGLYATDPHPLFTRLRAEAPVAWNEERGFWAVTTHADVSAIGLDHETFCSRRGILVDEIGVTYESPPTMMHTDPPAHTRYRRLVQPGFKPSVVRALEPAVRVRARALVEGLGSGGGVDVVALLSVPLPLQVISEIMGLPVEDWERFYEWSEAVIPGATDWPEERRTRLLGEMVTFLVDLTKDRRAHPRADVLTELAQASIGGDQLNDAELAMFLVQLLVAGNETTRNLISGGLVALAENPDQWNRLAGDRSLVPGAVEEMLRWTTPVVSFMRTATRDTELSGVAVAEGEPVLMVYASANRDEAVFGPGADGFDVGRHPNPHLSFGSGSHFCLGAALARLEGRIVLEELLDRFDTLELAGPVERSGSTVIAGVRRAELSFGPSR